jgi:hypothetical protein
MSFYKQFLALGLALFLAGCASTSTTQPTATPTAPPASPETVIAVEYPPLPTMPILVTLSPLTVLTAAVRASLIMPPMPPGFEPVKPKFVTTEFGKALVLTIKNTSGSTSYQVVVSQDLRTWNTLAIFEDGDAYVELHDYAWARNPYLYYAILPEPSDL